MKPVFVGGCDRSGTTLLGAILGAHPECACVPESQFVLDLLRERAQADPPLDMPRTFELIRDNFRFRLWGLQVEWDDEVERLVGSSYAKLVEWLARRYAEEHGKAGATIWVDHTPSNTKYAATLLEMFPEAKFLHIVRDGRAVSASICPLDWGPNAVMTAAPWWVERVGYGIAAETNFGAARVLRVRYEDMVLQTAETVQRITDFLGLAFDPAMLNAGGFGSPVYTKSQHSLVGHPPDRARVDAWQTSMTDRQVEIFEHLTGDLLAYLGYEPRYGAAATRPTERERFASAVDEVLGRCVNRFRRVRRIREARIRVATDVPSERRAGATV
jgi:hypothetical protein